MSKLLLVLASISCAHHAAHPPHDIDSARIVELANGEALVRGTIASDNRVDWIGLALPANQHGRVDLEMSYIAPRRGLRLGFGLFDPTSRPLAASVSETGRIHSAMVADARGTLFVRIFAPRRADAGTYKLTATFTPIVDRPPPPPPPPPAVVVAAKPAACTAFDPRDPACAATCPAYGAPPNWPACSEICQLGDPDTKPACLSARPCPIKPDIRYRRCTPDRWPACPDPTSPDLENPNCPRLPTFAPVVGRIVQVTVTGRTSTITINVGAGSHVDPTWTAHVIRADGTPQLGGAARILHVSKRGEVKLAVDLTLDELAAPNDRVQLGPPR